MGGTASGSLDLGGCAGGRGPVVLVGIAMIALVLLTMSSVAVLVTLAVLYAWCLTQVIGLH
jgi:hypothetical protein